MNYSFESPKVFDKLLLPKEAMERRAIAISNPLGEDFSMMRTLPVHGILQSLSVNFNRRNKGVCLYELANIYVPKELPLRELPDERMQFVLGFYGAGDFFDMKGVVEEFLGTVGLAEKFRYDPGCDKSFLHPGRRADLWYCKERIGYLGEVHPKVAANYKIGEKACLAVLDMPALMPFISFDKKYRGLARFPAMTRDISLTVPKSVLAGEIEEIIEAWGGPNLESFALFDIYEGSQIEEGYKSLAYTITFRNRERTLEDKEVNAVMEEILKALAQKNIQLRAM